MKVLHITWNAFGRDDIQAEFDRREYEVDQYNLERKEDHFSNQKREQEMIEMMSKKKYDLYFL